MDPAACTHALAEESDKPAEVRHTESELAAWNEPLSFTVPKKSFTPKQVTRKRHSIIHHPPTPGTDGAPRQRPSHSLEPTARTPQRLRERLLFKVRKGHSLLQPPRTRLERYNKLLHLFQAETPATWTGPLTGQWTGQTVWQARVAGSVEEYLVRTRVPYRSPRFQRPSSSTRNWCK